MSFRRILALAIRRRKNKELRHEEIFTHTIGIRGSSHPRTEFGDPSKLSVRTERPSAGRRKPDSPASIDQDIDMLRKDIRSHKKQIIAANVNSPTPKPKSSGPSTTSTPPRWSR